MFLTSVNSLDKFCKNLIDLVKTYNLKWPVEVHHPSFISPGEDAPDCLSVSVKLLEMEVCDPLKQKGLTQVGACVLRLV